MTSLQIDDAGFEVKFWKFSASASKMPSRIFFFYYKYAKQKLLPLPQIYWSTGKKKSILFLWSYFHLSNSMVSAFDEWQESALNEFLVTLKSKHSHLFLSYFFLLILQNKIPYPIFCSLALYLYKKEGMMKEKS